MKGKKLLVTLAASAVLFAGCGLKSGNTVIKVNDTKISKGQFDRKMDEAIGASMFGQMGIDLKNNKNEFLIYIVKQRVVNELIVKALMDEEIKRRGIKVSNKDIEDGVKEIIQKLGSKEQLDTILKQNGISPAQFKRDVAEQVRIRKMAEQLGDSSVSDAEAKAFYDKNIKKFTYDDQVRVSHILISANEKELDQIVRAENEGKNLTDAEIAKKVSEKVAEKKSEIEKIHNELKNDLTQFARIAKDKSQDPGSAVKGGDLGFFPKGQMVAEFERVAFSIKPNTLSEIFKTQYGYHILVVTDRKAAGKEPFEKVQDSIKAYLKNEKQVRYVDDLVESLKKNAKIEYVDSTYDPEYLQNEVQKRLDPQGEAAKEAEKVPDIQKK